MGGIFHYDSDSGLGYYMDDKEIAETGGMMVLGFGSLAVFYLIMILIGIAVLSPFVTLFVLDDFVENFIVNNSLFFVLMGVILTSLKLFTKTSGSLVVKILFDAYIIVAVLYFVLYVLKFDVSVYSFFKAIDNHLPADADKPMIEIWGIDNLTKATEGHWFYELVCGCIDKFLAYVKWAFTSIVNIDNSCFAAEQINIFATLKTIILYLAIGVFDIVTIVLFLLLMVIVALIVVLIPYVLALAAVVAINKLLYKVCTAKIMAVINKDYQAALSISKKELDEAINLRKAQGVNKKILETFDKIAKEGNPLAQATYAQCFLNGYGVPENEKMSFYWYKKAAWQGNVKSQLMTSFAYFDGIGTKKNKLLAKTWLELALKNQEYIKRHSDQTSIMEKIAKISKKTRWVDCF